MIKLSPAQLDALRKAERNLLPRPVTHREVLIIDALGDRGLITFADDWHRPRQIGRHPRITDLGRQVLNPPAARREQRPVFLTPARAAQDYTSDPARAVLDAGEVLDEQVVSRFAAKAREQDAARERQVAEERQLDRELLAAEDRLRLARKDANAARIDLRDEFRLVHKARARGDETDTIRHLRRIERTIHRRAA